VKTSLVRAGALVLYGPISLLYLIGGAVYDVGLVFWRSNESVFTALGVTDEGIIAMAFTAELSATLIAFAFLISHYL